MAFLRFFIFPETASRYSMMLGGFGEEGMGRAVLAEQGTSLLFLQLEDVKNPDARESHQDFCKHNRWTVLFWSCFMGWITCYSWDSDVFFC